MRYTIKLQFPERVVVEQVELSVNVGSNLSRKDEIAAAVLTALEATFSHRPRMQLERGVAESADQWQFRMDGVTGGSRNLLEQWIAEDGQRDVTLVLKAASQTLTRTDTDSAPMFQNYRLASNCRQVLLEHGYLKPGSDDSSVVQVLQTELARLKELETSSAALRGERDVVFEELRNTQRELERARRQIEIIRSHDDQHR